MTDTELHEDLISFIHATPATTASSLIEDYVRARPGADQGAVRKAMMGLISRGKIVVGAGPRWGISVRG